MREFEMRRRIEGFLKRRMQGMLAPALGLGLAVTGCGESSAVYSSPAPKEDAAGLSSGIPIYSAPVAPDAYVADAFVGEDTLPPGSDASLVDLTLVPDAGSDAMGEAGVAWMPSQAGMVRTRERVWIQGRISTT